MIPPTQPTRPSILLFGYGNPSRGDDALGPAFLERIAPHLDPKEVECLTDFQLQIEHALDLEGREEVIFIDASLDAEAPFSFTPLIPDAAPCFTTHALPPASVLSTYQDFFGAAPPPCHLLAIRGYAFDLFQPLSLEAEHNLLKGLNFALDYLA